MTRYELNKDKTKSVFNCWCFWYLQLFYVNQVNASKFNKVHELFHLSFSIFCILINLCNNTIIQSNVYYMVNCSFFLRCSRNGNISVALFYNTSSIPFFNPAALQPCLYSLLFHLFFYSVHTNTHTYTLSRDYISGYGKSEELVTLSAVFWCDDFVIMYLNCNESI